MRATSLLSNSRKCAVGPAEYRHTQRSRLSSTNCFPNVTNTSFANLGECIAPATAPFHPTSRTGSLQNALLAAVLPLSGYSLPSSFLHAHTVVQPCRLLRSCTSDTWALAPGVPFHRSAVLAPLSRITSTHAPSVHARNACPLSTGSSALWCTLACVLYPHLASQFALSSCWDIIVRATMCVACFHSRSLVGVLAACVPISLGPLRDPRIANRHVSLSCQ